MGYLIISPNRTNKHSFQRICELSKCFSKRTHNKQRRTRTNRNAACKASLNKIVRQTMVAKRTVNEQRKLHIYGVWNTLFGVFGEIGIGGYALFQQTSKQRTVSCADKGFCALLPSKRPANNEQTESKRNFLAFAEFGTLCLLVCSFAGF
ncbi:MAG: hypothetical protein IJ172_12870 [Ruminococcus sp.]|nr:hypothetical protein [Ruminococcus sp.]